MEKEEKRTLPPQETMTGQWVWPCRMLGCVYTAHHKFPTFIRTEVEARSNERYNLRSVQALYNLVSRASQFNKNQSETPCHEVTESQVNVKSNTKEHK